MNVRAESRTFPICTVILLVVVLMSLPGRYFVLPAWFSAIAGVLLIVPMIAISVDPSRQFWRRGERTVTGVVISVAILFNVLILTRLIADMLMRNKGVTPITLLSTAVAVWVTNVIAFAFLYWLVDRGGPTARSGGQTGRADLAFPRGDPLDGLPEDWRPSFGDYFFVAFNTSSAFSPTDTVPLTIRMKMLMVAQSTVSLVAIAVVAARAINILGT